VQIPPNFASGQALIALNEPGATQVTVSSGAPGFDFAIDNIIFDYSQNAIQTAKNPVSLPPIIQTEFDSAVALSIILGAIPPTSEIGAILGAGLFAISVGIDAVNLIDPFDPNYQVEYFPTFQTFATVQPSSTISQKLADDINATLSNGSQVVGYLQALDVSANRFNSAIQAGDQPSANLQNVAINTYLSLSSTVLTAFGQDLNTLAADLQATNVDSSISAQDVSNFLDTLKTQGFAALPQQAQAIFNNTATNFNVDPATFAQSVVSEFLSVNPANVPLSFVSALQAEAKSVDNQAAVFSPTVTDDDTSEQAALSLTVDNNSTSPIGAPKAGSVPFTVAGLDPEDTGTVTFSDGTNQVAVKVSAGQSDYTADLMTLSDGPITSTLAVDTDPTGNSFAPVPGNTVNLDTDKAYAPVLQVDGGTPNIFVNVGTAAAVPVTLTGLETGDTGTVTFTDSAGHSVPLAVSASQTSYTVNLSPLADGTITSSLLVTDAANNTTTATGNAVTLDQDKVAEAPILSIAKTSLTVQAGGSVPLGIKVAAVDGDDNVLVTISGVPQGFESITADDGHAPVVQHGANYTFTAADVNNGLTLHSTFGGKGHPVNALTVTATSSTAGESAASSSQTITVTGPPATCSRDHQDLALFKQFLAAGFHEQDGIPIVASSRAEISNGETFLTQPHH
jgi:hypothetical protein